MASQVTFVQLNMHRALIASTQLNHEIATEPKVCFITEPYTAFNKIANTPANHIHLPTTTLASRPRAAILLPRHTPHIFLEQLSNPDATVALLTTAKGKILIASIYLDYNDKQVTPTWLHDIAEYAENKNLPAIFAFDSNAHSRLYGPTENRRGRVFEEFIFKYSLRVENRGEPPTYHAFRHNASIDSCIDVTLSRGAIPIRMWRVESETFNGSDHHTIRWHVPLDMEPPELIRPWKQAKWDIFRNKISEHNFDEMPINFTTRKADKLLDRIYRVIGDALDEACPLRKAKPSPVEISWFKQNQRHLMNRAKRKYTNHMQHQNCPRRRKAFVKAKRLYHRSCRKAKRESWRLFIESTPGVQEMTLLTKIAQRKDKRTINTLQNPDGSLTQPGLETITALTSAHFPAATAGESPIIHDNSKKIDTADIKEKYKDWITEELVLRALKRFKPNKAAGPDGLKPIVFRHLPPNIISAITLLYQACIALGHTPKLKRYTKVIFLPKPNKPCYGIAKAYRPISLSNYLLKSLERLVVWRMDADLKSKPLRPQQHGFTKGKSTKSAISNSLNYIEEFLFQGQHCLGLFLDISSAFDSISIDHIKQSLLDHNGLPDLVNWYYSYLGGRYLEVTLHGETLRLTTSTGFPQGGVCSASFWLIAFDKAIEIINSRGAVGTGYADDCGVLLGGSSYHNMIDQIQPLLSDLVEWGHTCGLRFNAQKTVAIMFSRSKKIFTRRVRMDGALIPYSTSVVYLGVTLDYRLFWNEHIKNKIAKTKSLLMKLASLIHSYWGPRPKLMKWAYTGIIRPVLTYAAMVWAHEAETSSHVKALRKLNRLAISTMVKVPRSTPTRALVILLGITPLHLHVLQVGLAAYKRLQSKLPFDWEGIHPNLTHSVSHLKFWEYQDLDLGLGNGNLTSDECYITVTDKKFVVDGESFVDMAACQCPANCSVYIDGSKTNDKVGAGVYMLWKGARVTETCFRLPPHATVFQAETMAIREATYILHQMSGLTEVKFFVDSQSVLRALQSPTVTSQLMLQTMQALNEVQANSITFVWTKAHIGISGNEKADVMAKAGAELPDDKILVTPSSTCNLKAKIKEAILDL